jgi:hypothetical protein
MPGGGSLWDKRDIGFRTEQEQAYEAMFPAKTWFQRLQMMTETQPRAIVPWSVLGIFRRLYGSKVLTYFQEENNTNNIAKERAGRLEAEAIWSRPRLKDESKEGEP